MVGTEYISLNFGLPDLVLSKIGNQKIINTPSGIILPCIAHIRPPGVFHFVRVQISEGINKPQIQKPCKPSTLLVGKPRIVAVSLRVLKVNVACRNVQVTANDDRFSFWG